MQEIYDFLKKCKTYYLATVEGDQPRVRPFGTIDWFDGRLTIQTGRSKNVSKQMLENPKIEICAFDGEKWLRVSALAVEDPRLEAQQHMLDTHPSLKSRYQAGDGNTQIFALEHGTAVFSSFTEEPKTITF